MFDLRPEQQSENNVRKETCDLQKLYMLYGFSDEIFLNGGLEVFITTPSDATNQRVIGAGAIASCYTYELLTIIEALDLYETFPILEQAKGLVLFCDSKAALRQF
ncbi:hypothetical protein TNCV_2109881 [Trichonephila clavipes]|nr:hypothetical protein TNCV_2109881 [Trichonephila clavipes]